MTLKRKKGIIGKKGSAGFPADEKSKAVNNRTDEATIFTKAPISTKDR